MLQMIVEALPSMADSFAKAYENIDSIKIIGGDASGANSLMNNIPVGMAKVFESIKETTGFDMVDVLKADTLEAQVNKNVNVTGIDKISVDVVDKSVEKKASKKNDEPTLTVEQ
jgi:flotillin